MWQLVVLDLHQLYGVDLSDPGLTGSRTWDWLKDRIAGALYAPKAIAPNGMSYPTSRLGWHFDPPQPPNS